MHHLALRATAHRAALYDRAAVPLLLDATQDEFPRRRHVRVDQGYTGKGRAWIDERLGWAAAVVQHPPKPRGVWAPVGATIDWHALRPEGVRGVLPRRWVLERPFSWCGQRRRLSNEYERRCETSEAFHAVALIRIMARRLARP